MAAWLPGSKSTTVVDGTPSRIVERPILKNTQQPFNLLASG